MPLPPSAGFPIASDAADARRVLERFPARTLRPGRASLVVLCLAVLLLAERPPPAVAAQPWLRPVPGAVVRAYDYARSRPFAAGAHRGVDLVASPGAVVRAACTGRVVHAGTVTHLGRVVTVRCGSRRVTYMPLGTLAVGPGASVYRGARIGTVAAGHGGLHVGVRRADDRWAYEDPLTRMGADPPALPVLARPVTRPPRPSAPGVPSAGPAARALPRAGLPASSSRTAQAPARPVLAFSPHTHAHHGTAPLQVWLGAALVLAGTVRSFTVSRRRRRTVPARAGAPARAAR